MAYNPYTGQDDQDPNESYDPNAVDPNNGNTAPPPPDKKQNAGPQGVGDPGNDANQIQGWAQQYLGRNFTPSDISALNGQPLDLVMHNIANSDEARAYANRGQAPAPAGQPAGLTHNIFTGGGQGGWQQYVNSFQQDPRFSDLVNTLLDRSKKSLDIDPTTDPVIRPQVDNYAATQERGRRNYLNELAESSSPYSTGALQTARTQTAESAGINTANLQSSLMNNELTARRGEIQNALMESGSMLTSNQQLQLQQELGLIDAQLKQQGINSNNDQFAAQLGLNATNMGNYWDWLRSGGKV